MAIKQGCSPSKAGDMSLEEFKQWLKQFDTDGDGRISKDELRTAIRSVGGWFSRWKSGQGLKVGDADGSGFIDEGEIENLVSFAQKSLGMRVVAY